MIWRSKEDQTLPRVSQMLTIVSHRDRIIASTVNAQLFGSGGRKREVSKLGVLGTYGMRFGGHGATGSM